LESDYKRKEKVVRVITDEGEQRENKIDSESDLPHLRNPTILIGQNDLTALSYLTYHNQEFWHHGCLLILIRGILPNEPVSLQKIFDRIQKVNNINKFLRL
jgi:hypothetical protein